MSVVVILSAAGAHAAPYFCSRSTFPPVSAGSAHTGSAAAAAVTVRMEPAMSTQFSQLAVRLYPVMFVLAPKSSCGWQRLSRPAAAAN